VARLYGGALGAAAASIIALMRAAPTFVVMFFLLNAIPRDAALFGVPLALSGIMAVALSLLPYAAAYIADAGVEALEQLRRGSPLGSLLFLPNVTRAFFVLVMSSSAGAAIGVTEGITVILRQAEQLPTLDDRLALFAIGMPALHFNLGADLNRHSGAFFFVWCLIALGVNGLFSLMLWLSELRRLREERAVS